MKNFEDFYLIFWSELNKVIGQKVIMRNNLIINGYDKIKIERCNIHNSAFCDLFYDK